MTKIELDNLRLSKYQELSNNLETVKEFFRHGDILIKQINTILEEIKNLIDNNLETSFTREDFNYMLDLRNNVLFPIFRNASFAKEFDKYSEVIITPTVVEPIIETTVSYNINNGNLLGATIVDTVNNEVSKTTYLTYTDNILVEKKIVENNTTTTIKYSDNIIYESIVTIQDNILEITNNVYESQELKSTEYSKYINGIKQ